MPQTRAELGAPSSLVNQIRNLPKTGPILGDIFDGIQRALVDINTRVAAIKPGTTATGAVASVAGEATASYLDTTLDPDVITAFDGAIARDIGLRFGDYLSVLDFGADPTATADSTAAINAAIAAAQTGLGTKSVHIPWGTYKVGGTIVVTGATPVKIIGTPGAKLLRAAGFTIGNPIMRLNVEGCELRNLILESNDIADTLGLRVQKPGCVLSDVRITQFGRLIYTDANSHGLRLTGCELYQRAAATLPPVELASTNACIFINNTFAVETKAVVYESGTSDTNYVPMIGNYILGAEVPISPRTDSTSALISSSIQFQDSDPFTTDTNVFTVTFDQGLFRLISRLGAVAETQLEINPATKLTTVADFAANLVTTPVGMISNMLGLGGGYVEADGDSIPDTVALFRFRPADDAVDISVTTSAGVRVWKQLFPIPLTPTAENVASVTCVPEYQYNENGFKIKWRAVGTVTYGANRTSIKYHRLHLIGPSITGGDPLMNQEFAYLDAPPPDPDVTDYFTDWFDLPPPDSSFKVAVYVYDANDTLTPSPTESAYAAVDAAEPELNIADFGATVTVEYEGAGFWRLDFNVTLPVDRLALLAIVPRLAMAGTDWVQDLGDQDVPPTGPAVFSCGKGNSWQRPEADETHVANIYFRDIYNREIGPIAVNVTVEAFVFTNISTISLTHNTSDYPGFARFTGTATIPTLAQDPDFAGVRVYGFYGDPTGITFDDLFIVTDVDHEPGTVGPITFDFNVQQPASDSDLRLYFASKHQGEYDTVRFSGGLATPYIDDTVVAIAGASEPPSKILSLSTITLTGTDPLKRNLTCTANVPTAANGFDGCFVWKMVGTDGPYLLGFAHHPVGTGSPFTVDLPIDLPETAETGAVIFFQPHSMFGPTAELDLTGTDTTNGTVDIPARPTSTSTAPLASSVTSVTISEEYRAGQYRFNGTIVFPADRSSIKQFLLRIYGPIIGGTTTLVQDQGVINTPASGNYTWTTEWYDLADAGDFKYDCTSYNEDNIPTLPAVVSNTVTIVSATASGAGTLATGLTLTRVAVPASADGVEQTAIKAAFNFPTDTRIAYVYGTVRVSTEGTDKERRTWTVPLENGMHGDATDEMFGPWNTVAETYVVSVYSVDVDGNEFGPATQSLAVTPGAGSLQLGRAASGSFDSSRFEIVSNQFKVKGAGIKLADLDTLNIQVADFSGNLNVTRVNNLNTLTVSSFSGNLDISRINNVNTINIDNLSGVLNASKINNLGALDIGTMGGAITISKISNLGSFNIQNFAGVIVTSQLAAGILSDLTKFSDSLRPITKVSFLPGLPNAAYPVNTVVLNGADSRLYRNNSNVWTVVTASDTISGKITNADIVSVNAGVINGLIVSAQIQSLNVNQLNGTIQASQVGVLQGSQIQNLIANTITIGQINDSQISSVSVGKLSAGTITLSNWLTVTGFGFNVYINASVGIQVTGSSGNAVNIVSGNVQITASGGNNSILQPSKWEMYSPSYGYITADADPFFGLRFRVRDLSSVGVTITPGAVVIGGTGYFQGRYRFTEVYSESNFLGGITSFNYLPAYNSAGTFIGKIPLI